MTLIFTLFMLMLKDELFFYLKSRFLFLFCSLFSSKNLLNFLGGGVGGGGCSIYSTSRGERGSMNLD